MILGLLKLFIRCATVGFSSMLSAITQQMDQNKGVSHGNVGLVP